MKILITQEPAMPGAGFLKTTLSLPLPAGATVHTIDPIPVLSNLYLNP